MLSILCLLPSPSCHFIQKYMQCRHLRHPNFNPRHCLWGRIHVIAHGDESELHVSVPSVLKLPRNHCIIFRVGFILLSARYTTAVQLRLYLRKRLRYYTHTVPVGTGHLFLLFCKCGAMSTSHSWAMFVLVFASVGLLTFGTDWVCTSFNMECCLFRHCVSIAFYI